MGRRKSSRWHSPLRQSGLGRSMPTSWLRDTCQGAREIRLAPGDVKLCVGVCVRDMVFQRRDASKQRCCGPDEAAPPTHTMDEIDVRSGLAAGEVAPGIC